MICKGVIFEDFVNYKVPCMTIEMPVCKNFKCDKECGRAICQNGPLANAKLYNYSNEAIIATYHLNPIVKALCFQGLEPFDTFCDMYVLIKDFRQESYDDVVIYTGYNEDEISEQVEQLKQFKNIIIKFGRYVPDQDSVIDEVLGVKLASPNQYARRIS